MEVASIGNDNTSVASTQPSEGLLYTWSLWKNPTLHNGLWLKQELPCVAQRLRDATFGKGNRDGAKKTKFIEGIPALNMGNGIEMLWLTTCCGVCIINSFECWHSERKLRFSMHRLSESLRFDRPVTGLKPLMVKWEIFKKNPDQTKCSLLRYEVHDSAHCTTYVCRYKKMFFHISATKRNGGIVLDVCNTLADQFREM